MVELRLLLSEPLTNIWDTTSLLITVIVEPGEDENKVLSRYWKLFSRWPFLRIVTTASSEVSA